MELKPFEDFKNAKYYIGDEDGVITMSTLPLSPHNYFAGFNTLRIYSIDHRNLVIPREKLEEKYEPVDTFNYVEYSSDRKEFVSYVQVYKEKSLDYYVVIDIELKEDGDDGSSVFSFDEVRITHVYYDSSSPKRCKDMIDDLNKLFEGYTPKAVPHISMVLKTMAGYTFKKRKIKPYQTDISKNYNDEFVDMYDDIVDRLTNDDKGILLLYGLAGTGKTNLIRHLTAAVPNKDFVYIPVSMVPHLTDPTFISMLMDRKNLILVLEDSEIFLKDRKNSGENTVVSTLLNLSDGLMTDALGIQIICTFNADLDDIDEALLRDGRLIAEHKFDKLSLEKTKVLAQEVGFEATESMTLAQIYNKNNAPHRTKNKKKQIGFGK